MKVRDMATRGPEPKVSDDEMIDVMDNDDRPFSTVSYVSERVDLSNTRVRERLADMVEKGYIRSEEVAGDIKIYWSDSAAEFR